jgi:arylformamidase
LSHIIDISPLISSRMAVWPGDKAYTRTPALSIDAGDNIDLSAIHTTVHLGAHTDAPSHYLGGGEGIAARDLERYMGPAQVICVSTQQGARIQPEDLPVKVVAERVLFRTDSYPDPECFNEDFCSLSVALVHALAQSGVVLVGIDTPSIDPFSSETLPAHAAVATHDMGILEGIVLAHVADGLYDLVALPLRLEGADASPVRAVLVER